MRSSLAIFCAAALRLAAASQPDDGFHLASILASYSDGCRSAETLRLGVTAESMVVDYLAMREPTYRSSACVALFDLAAVPNGWRFAVDEVRHEGHVKLPQGAAIASTDFSLGIANSYVVNPADDRSNFTWSTNAGGVGDFKKNLDWAVDRDADMDYNLTVARAEPERHWSPCFAGYDEMRKTQLSMETFFYFDNTTAAADNGYNAVLRTTIPLVWEQCDPAKFPPESWGTHVGLQGPCK